MKLSITILRLALCAAAAAAASVHLSESQLRQNPDTIPLADLEPLTPLKQCYNYCMDTLKYKARRGGKGDWNYIRCLKACKEDPNYAEQPTETWRAMFVLQAKDCERVADEFMKERPRDVMDLPEHLKRMGC